MLRYSGLAGRVIICSELVIPILDFVFDVNVYTYFLKFLEKEVFNVEG